MEIDGNRLPSLPCWFANSPYKCSQSWAPARLWPPGHARTSSSCVGISSSVSTRHAMRRGPHCIANRRADPTESGASATKTKGEEEMVGRGILICALLLPVSALAAGAPRRVPRIDRPCANDCRQALRECQTAAHDDAQACAEPCADLVDAAHTACEVDQSSDECSAARQAAAVCLKPCREASRPAIRACISAGESCVRSCLPNRGDNCGRQCLADGRDCLAAARADARTCADGCSAEHEAARQACSADRESQQCAAARDALETCLQPCLSDLGDAIKTCREKTGACVSACAAQ